MTALLELVVYDGRLALLGVLLALLLAPVLADTAAVALALGRKLRDQD